MYVCMCVCVLESVVASKIRLARGSCPPPAFLPTSDFPIIDPRRRDLGSSLFREMAAASANVFFESMAWDGCSDVQPVVVYKPKLTGMIIILTLQGTELMFIIHNEV